MGEWAMAMPLGSPLPGYDGGTFLYGDERWTWKGKVREIPAAGTVPDVAELLHYARRYLRTPYLWGGRTVFGVDCSGFASSVLRAFGVVVRRDCVQQIEEGEKVRDLGAAVPGDLVYFAPSGEAAQHVGIVLPCGEVIHEPFSPFDQVQPGGDVRNQAGRSDIAQMESHCAERRGVAVANQMSYSRGQTAIGQTH
jgi:cell wall-associated NlpC family hydrolase